MFVDNTQQCFAFTPQATFPPIIWIFTDSEGVEIESRLPFKIFFTLPRYYFKDLIWIQNWDGQFLQYISIWFRLDHASFIIFQLDCLAKNYVCTSYITCMNYIPLFVDKRPWKEILTTVQIHNYLSLHKYSKVEMCIWSFHSKRCSMW